MSESELLDETISRRKLKGYLHYAPSKHIGNPQAFNEFLQWFRRTGEKDEKKKVYKVSIPTS